MPSPCTQTLILKILPPGGSDKLKGGPNSVKKGLLSPE
nr:MAG TPA: hypothetical protein [Caudoviricetes sp.]